MNTITAITAAAKRCRAAFAKYPNATWAWCCHHERWFELLTEPAENRIVFILESKIASERVCRLNNFRPVRNEKSFKTALDAYDAAAKPALDAYDAAVKTARDAYNAAVKTASDAYNAAVKPASDAYNAAVKPASADLRKLYKKEVPLGTKAFFE